MTNVKLAIDASLSDQEAVKAQAVAEFKAKLKEELAKQQAQENTTEYEFAKLLD